MQDKAVRHKCRTATHRAAVQRGFLGIFCTAFCTAFFFLNISLPSPFAYFTYYRLFFAVHLPSNCTAVQKNQRFYVAF